jgi:uncharacterized membrane protein
MNCDRKWISIRSVQVTSTALPETQAIAVPLQDSLEPEQCTSVEDKLADDCNLDIEQTISQEASDRQLEQSIGNILKYGVLLSSAVVLVGGILYLIRHGTEPADYQLFQGQPSIFRSPDGVVTAILSGHRRGIIQLGLLLLIATPIARVAFSCLAFLKQRDFSYIIITLCVLMGLIYSLLGAYS